MGTYVCSPVHSCRSWCWERSSVVLPLTDWGGVPHSNPEPGAHKNGLSGCQIALWIPTYGITGRLQDYLVYMWHSGTSILMLEWEVLNHGTVSPVSLPLSLLLRQLSLYYTGEDLGLPGMPTPPAFLPSVRATGAHLQSHPPILLFCVKMLLYNKNISVFPISQFMANIFLFSRL